MITFGGQAAGRATGASLYIYDLSTGQQVNALSGHNRPTTAIAVSPDGTLALTGSLTPELRLWSLLTGREVRSISQSQLAGYVGAASSLQFVNGTNLALIGRAQAGVHIWNLESNVPVLAFKGPFRGTSSALVTFDQKAVLAISHSDVTVVAWEFTKGDLLGVFSEEWMSGYPYVSLTRNGKPRSWWESDTGKPWPEGRPTPLQWHPGFMDQAMLSPDGRILVTYGNSITTQNAKWLHLWDLESGKLLWHHPALDLPMISTFRPAQSCAAIAFSPDSRTLAIGRRDEGLAIHELRGDQLRQELKTPAGSCTRIAFLPDGKQLLTWGDKTMRLWDLRTAKMIRSFNVPAVNCLALTPDGRFVLVGSDGEFRGV